MGARPKRPVRPERNWRRYLGPPNSWRRVTWTGIGGGVALALVAALIATAVGGRGFGSLDTKQPTAVVPVSNSSDVADQSQPPAEELPTDTPVEEPTVEEPVDLPADTPVDEAPVETPTEELVVPTDTPVDEAPTDVPPAEQ